VSGMTLRSYTAASPQGEPWWFPLVCPSAEAQKHRRGTLDVGKEEGERLRGQ